MWTIFKVFIEFVTVLLLFYVLLFGCQACGILALQPGIKPASPAMEGEALTHWTARAVPSVGFKEEEFLGTL